MSDREDKNRRQWEVMRSKGKWNFILRKGVFFWGGSMFVIMGVVFPTLTHSPNTFSPRMLGINAVLWPLGGLLWGIAIWFIAERNYKRNQSAGNESQ